MQPASQSSAFATLAAWADAGVPSGFRGPSCAPARQFGPPDSVYRERPESKASRNRRSPACGAGSNGLTVTANCALAELPSESAAEHLTVRWPTANVAPLAGLHSTATAAPAASRALAAYATTAPDGEVAATAMSAGTVIAGGVGGVPAGVTVTVNADMASLPAASDARQTGKSQEQV